MDRRTSVRSLSASALVTFALAGCILFVDPPSDVSLTCHFEGESANDCGRCIAASCQSAVNGCCASGSCKSALAALDTCGRGGGCSTLLGQSSGAEWTALDECVKTSCGAVCSLSEAEAGPLPEAATSALFCANLMGSCQCTGQSSGNDAMCSPTSLGVDPSSVLCCADNGYPHSGTRCTCQWIGCMNNGPACVCGNALGQPGGQCTGSTCCRQLSAPGCVCGAAACPSGFSPMGATCAVADLQCLAGQRSVPACR